MKKIRELKYDTVLFDADGTLMDFLRSEREALTDCLKALGLPHGDGIIEVYSRINDSYWKKLERKEIEKERLKVARFETFCEHYGFECDVNALARAYTDTLATKAYLIDGAEDICHTLYDSGCRLYIITNGIKSVQDSRFHACGLAPMFEKAFISEELGFEKPDIRYFEKVESDIDNFSKSNTLVVGDSLTSDILGGINFGVDVCYFNQFGKSIPESIKEKVTYTVSRLDEIADIVLN